MYINGSSFATKVDFTTGLYPRSLAIGDIDNDGKLDLVTANFSSNSISALRNTSTPGSITIGSFAATVNFTAGSGPHAISISDLDGDGRNDIVVANAGSASIGVFKNQSTPGAFTAASLAVKVDFTAGFGPVNLALGDVDGDGKNDMTVSNGGANTFSVFRNLIGEISLPTVSSFTPSFGSAGTSITITAQTSAHLLPTLLGLTEYLRPSPHHQLRLLQSMCPRGQQQVSLK
jgi:FG-GAP-like repeat